jgi:hypothetical protein
MPASDSRSRSRQTRRPPGWCRCPRSCFAEKEPVQVYKILNNKLL